MTVSEPFDSNSPTVSIIMANYNGAPYLAESIGSACRQTLRNIEIIVSDDASTDTSVGIVNQLIASDSRIRLVTSDKNTGPAAARNRAIHLAKGKWIAVADGDDCMHPARLATLLDAATRDSADIVADDLLIFDAAYMSPPQTLLKGSWSATATWVDAATFIRMNHFYSRQPILGYLKPLIKSSLLAGVFGPYDESLRIAEDYNLLLRLLLSGAKFRVYPTIHYFYRKHASSISHRLNVNAIVAMQNADLQLQQSFGDKHPAITRALVAKTRSVNAALAYEHLLNALKMRAYLSALSVIFASPRAFYLLRFAIEARLHRFLSLLRLTPRPGIAGRRQVCIMSRQLPDHAANGSWTFLFDLFAVLVAEGIDVHFLSPCPAALLRKPVFLLQGETSVFKTFRVRGAWRIGKWVISKNFRHLFWQGLAACQERGFSARPKPRQAPSSIATALTREDQLFIARNVPQPFDYLLADDWSLTDAFPYALRPDAHSAVIIHNLSSSQASQLLEPPANSHATLFEHDEIASLAQASYIILQYKQQIALIDRRLPNHRVIVTPIAARPLRAAQPGDSDLILFVGGRTESNIDGLEWFLASCWPLIREGRPRTQFWVAGAVSQALPTAPEGVRFLGLVEDLTSLYRDAGVVISPLRIGSLAEDELIEALEHGKAIVTTPAALPSGAHIFTDAITIAEGPTGFAGAVARLLDDEALRVGLGMKGLGILFQKFVPKSCYAPLINIFRSPEIDQSALRDTTIKAERLNEGRTVANAPHSARTNAADILDNKNRQSTVTVCICTFRRASIASTLYSVTTQVLPGDLKCRIIVVDNDFERTAEPLVSRFRAEKEMPVEYVHAPGQNISIARNAGLKACKTRWLAFLDDDEIASVNWLDRLMALREHASAVFGPSEAVYSRQSPKWVREVDLHSNRLIWRRGVVDSWPTT